jgi:hypothetical protein
MNKEKKYFLITSYGRTATYWIASLLNQHKDIICNHGPSISDVSFDVSKNEIPDEYVLKIHKDKNIFFNLTLDELFDNLQKRGPAEAYGNVHGYAAHSIPSLLKNSNRKINVINIVRHPITRIESLYRRIIYEMNFNNYLKEEFQNQYINIVSDNISIYVKNEFNINIDNFKNKIFLYVLCLVINHDYKDLNTNILHVQMERITKDREYFIWVLKYLMDNSIFIDKSYIDTISYIKRKNIKNYEILSSKQYELWDVWKKETFKKMLNNETKDKYDKLNYSFPF